MECVEQNSCNDPGYIMPSGRCINIDVDEDHFSFIRVDQSCLNESLVEQELERDFCSTSRMWNDNILAAATL